MAELNYSSGKQGGRSLTKKMPVRVDLTAMVDLAFTHHFLYADHIVG